MKKFEQMMSAKYAFIDYQKQEDVESKNLYFRINIFKCPFLVIFG